MLRSFSKTLMLAALILASALSVANAQTGRRDPLQAAWPTVPMGGNAAHGGCPVIVGNEDGPVIRYLPHTTC